MYMYAAEHKTIQTTLMPIPPTPMIPNAQCSNFSSVLSNVFRLRAQKEVDMM